jgi:DNA-binding NarL/FixJ family response regulator
MSKGISSEASVYYRLPTMPAALATAVQLQPFVDGQVLQKLFNLTAGEVDITQKLAIGETVEKIAVSRDVSEGTVRVQLKSIFHKMEVSSQAQLVSRALSVSQRLGI